MRIALTRRLRAPAREHGDVGPIDPSCGMPVDPIHGLKAELEGSANRAKAGRVLAREYEKVANRRADFAHKFSNLVVNENSAIACETLNLKGMSRTKLAKSVSDAEHRETFR